MLCASPTAVSNATKNHSFPDVLAILKTVTEELLFESFFFDTLLVLKVLCFEIMFVCSVLLHHHINSLHTSHPRLALNVGLPCFALFI